MVEIKVREQQIESIEKRGKVMTAEEQRIKERKIALEESEVYEY